MVSVTTSSRCQQCKARKRKCDEEWPVCGLCRRVGDACSGPPAAFSQFVPFRRGDLDASNCNEKKKASATKKHDVCLVLNRQKSAPSGGGILSTMRIQRRSVNTSNPIPITPLLTGISDDIITRRLVSILDGGAGTPYDVVLRAGWVHLIPARLVHGSSLWHAVDIFTRCWIIKRRDVFEDHAKHDDIKSYSRAIYSLQATLSDGSKAGEIETLAAVGLIYFCEEEMEFCQGRFSNCHASGISALLNARGLPDISDELEVRLSLEMPSNLVQHFINHGEPKILQQSTWLESMEQAIGADGVIEVESRISYELCLYMIHWVRLAGRMKALYSKPSIADAEVLASEALTVCQALEAFENNQMHSLRWRPHEIACIADNECPGNQAFDFDDWLSCEVLCLHALVSTAVTQIYCSALRLARVDSTRLPICKLYDLSLRVWKSIPYALRQQPSRKLLVGTAVTLSIEQAEYSYRPILATKASILLGKYWPSAIKDSYHGVIALRMACKNLTGCSTKPLDLI